MGRWPKPIISSWILNYVLLRKKDPRVTRRLLLMSIGDETLEKIRTVRMWIPKGKYLLHTHTWKIPITGQSSTVSGYPLPTKHGGWLTDSHNKRRLWRRLECPKGPHVPYRYFGVTNRRCPHVLNKKEKSNKSKNTILKSSTHYGRILEVGPCLRSTGVFFHKEQPERCDDRT